METFNFDSLNLKKIKTAIDVGCGNGRHLKSLGFRLLNAKILGIEEILKLSPQSLSIINHIPPGGSWKNIPYELLPERMKKIIRDSDSMNYLISILGTTGSKLKVSPKKILEN